jgi:hypothetical protein
MDHDFIRGHNAQNESIYGIERPVGHHGIRGFRELVVKLEIIIVPGVVGDSKAMTLM